MDCKILWNIYKQSCWIKVTYYYPVSRRTRFKCQINSKRHSEKNISIVWSPSLRTTYRWQNECYHQANWRYRAVLWTLPSNQRVLPGYLKYHLHQANGRCRAVQWTLSSSQRALPCYLKYHLHQANGHCWAVQWTLSSSQWALPGSPKYHLHQDNGRCRALWSTIYTKPMGAEGLAEEPLLSSQMTRLNWLRNHHQHAIGCNWSGWKSTSPSHWALQCWLKYQHHHAAWQAE